MVKAKEVLNLGYRNRSRPSLIVTGDTPIVVFLLDGIGQHIQRPFQPKLFHHLGQRPFSQPVIPIVQGNRRFNRFFAGNIRLMGGAEQRGFLMLPGIIGGVGINRDVFGVFSFPG